MSADRPATYLFHYSGHYTREQVKAFLDARPEVLHWITCLPNSFFVVSTASAVELSEAARSALGPKGLFLVLATRGERDGWLPPDAWDLMEKPKATAEKLKRETTAGPG